MFLLCCLLLGGGWVEGEAVVLLSFGLRYVLAMLVYVWGWGIVFRLEQLSSVDLEYACLGYALMLCMCYMVDGGARTRRMLYNLPVRHKPARLSAVPVQLCLIDTKAAFLKPKSKGR